MKFSGIRQDSGSWTSHYNQNESFFLKLPDKITVPHFPVYHNIELTTPSSEYINALKTLLSDIVSMVPQVFDGLTYFFDPTEIFSPCFFQLYKAAGQNYLYLVRLNIGFKANEGDIIEAGGNDITHKYVTDHLFLESDFIPLEDVSIVNGRIHYFKITQYIQQTWVGEKGRGYFLRGIWLDEELTKFFSRLFIPAGKRSYPYYPFTCKYKTICHSVLNLDPAGRRRHLPFLVKAIEFLKPRLGQIETSKNRD